MKLFKHNTGGITLRQPTYIHDLLDYCIVKYIPDTIAFSMGVPFYRLTHWTDFTLHFKQISKLLHIEW